MEFMDSTVEQNNSLLNKIIHGAKRNACIYKTDQDLGSILVTYERGENLKPIADSIAYLA
jgi:hypothetical protein